MSWRHLFCVLVVTTTAFLSGCGKSDKVVELPQAESNDLSSADELKTRLDQIIADGQAGSATMGMAEAIDGLSVDEGKKEALKKDLAELDATSDPAKIKSIAESMKSKL